MKKSIVISAALLSLCAFGYTEVDFNQVVTNLSECIRLAQYNASQIDSQVDTAYNELHYQLEGAIRNAGMFNDDYHNGYKEGTQDTYDISIIRFGNIRSHYNNLASDLADAQMQLANLRYVTTITNNFDLTPLINAINQLEQTLDSDLTTANGHLSNILDYVIHIQEGIGSLTDIVYDISQSLGSGSGGSGDDDLSELVSICSDILSVLSDYFLDASAFFEYVNDAQGEFKKFFEQANSRMETPDAMLATDLARMWQYTFQNFTNIVQHPERYLPSAQVDSVLQIDGENLRLSNEGLIAAHNLAMNQRQYLCSLAMLEELKGMNATNNLAWITNYLATVQKPYYMMFDQFSFNLTRGQTFPFKNSTYNAITNFFAVASNPFATPYQKTQAHSALANDSASPYRTNYWARLEMYLQGLNGFFETATGWTELQENLDSETMSHHIEDTTNNLASVVETIGSMSNSLVAVTGAFKDFMDSFDFDMGEYNSGVFTVCPSFSLGSIQIPTLHVDYNDLSFFVTPCRNFFQFLWYTVFAVFSFKFVLVMFRLLVKSISHVVLVISTLFS